MVYPKSEGGDGEGDAKSTLPREGSAPMMEELLAEAHRVVESLKEKPPVVVDQKTTLPAPVLPLRWFMLPSEAAHLLRSPSATLEELRGGDLNHSISSSNGGKNGDEREEDSSMQVEAAGHSGGDVKQTTAFTAAIPFTNTSTSTSNLCRNCFHPHSMGKVAPNDDDAYDALLMLLMMVMLAMMMMMMMMMVVMVVVVENSDDQEIATQHGKS
eukprot:jgi/Bigna1/133947/aug1.23_g8655